MAFASDIRALEQGIVARITATFRDLADRRAKYRMFRRTVEELSALSDRELNDLGINRSNIVSVARSAAYDA